MLYGNVFLDFVTIILFFSSTEQVRRPVLAHQSQPLGVVHAQKHLAEVEGQLRPDLFHPGPVLGELAPVVGLERISQMPTFVGTSVKRYIEKNEFVYQQYSRL